MDLKKASFQILRLSFPVKAHFYNGFLHMGWLSFLSLTVGPMDFPRKEDGKVPFLEGYNVFPFCLAIERDITRFTPIFGHIGNMFYIRKAQCFRTFCHELDVDIAFVLFRTSVLKRFRLIFIGADKDFLAVNDSLSKGQCFKIQVPYSSKGLLEASCHKGKDAVDLFLRSCNHVISPFSTLWVTAS